MRRRAVRATTTWAAVALMCLALAGCSDDGEEGTEPSPSVPSSSAPAAATTVVSTGSVQGFLTDAQRAAVTTEVGQVVDGWLESAWVGGEWPRTPDDAAWAAFTEGAAAKARKDVALTTGAHYAGRVSAVRATRRELKVDVLAQQGTAHGATARVTLNLTVTPTEEGVGEQKVVLRGRVFLIREGPGAGQWKIFGYDLARGGW